MGQNSHYAPFRRGPSAVVGWLRSSTVGFFHPWAIAISRGPHGYSAACRLEPRILPKKKRTADPRPHAITFASSCPLDTQWRLTRATDAVINSSLISTSSRPPGWPGPLVGPRKHAMTAVVVAVLKPRPTAKMNKVHFRSVNQELKRLGCTFLIDY
jgi:hypothetical protein